MIASTMGIASDIFTKPLRRVACQAVEVGLGPQQFNKNSGHYHNVYIRFEVPDLTAPSNLCLWDGGWVAGDGKGSLSSMDLLDRYAEENFNDAAALFHEEHHCYLHPNFPEASVCDLGRGLAQIGGYERAFSGILILGACNVIGLLWSIMGCCGWPQCFFGCFYKLPMRYQIAACLLILAGNFAIMGMLLALPMSHLWEFNAALWLFDSSGGHFARDAASSNGYRIA